MFESSAGEDDPIPWEAAPRHVLSTPKHIILYSLDVLRPAIKLLKYPLVVIVFLLLLATLLRGVSGVIKNAFSPVCYIPVIRSTHACQLINSLPEHGSSGGKVQQADYASLMNLEAKTFDQLVDNSAGSAGSLSLDLKKSEVACNDLINVVRHSDIKSKDLLAEMLVEFTNDANVAWDGLTVLSARFNGALDTIMAVNDYALRSVAEARAAEPNTLGERVNAMMPWSPPRKDVDLVVRETFQSAMDTLTIQLDRLMFFAATSSLDLNRLVERLKTLSRMVHDENRDVIKDKEEVLSELWTILGGNQHLIRRFDRNLKLLEGLTSGIKQSRDYVIAAVHILKGMSREMEDIRDRVAQPGLTQQIPPEVHMESIQMGLDRLKQNRLRARELDQEAIRRIKV
ncbi:hypothetical protein BKA70DRAFT_1103309 [Coprinopsis sp. MPI-PUGE-AT-0042]|nr:hypothetical protein BKA70DRAFT_1104918 [Coprinopsis sp. MPI-PUGE-AT-0042]KAH6908635.1 hypothetical protein BKA70DRAFT_1103309 [Coprinopsis sp. MPI-PUGE-AT-0042]